MGYNQIEVAQSVSQLLRKLGVDIEPAKLILDEPLGADEHGDFGGATNYVDRNTSGNKIIEGKSYTVTTDSGSYTSVCKKFSLGDESLLFVGNGKLFGLEDTGESFFVSSQFDVNSYLLICADFNRGNHIKVELPETIHPIDPKFIPWDSAPGGSGGGGLPVVELETEIETSTDDAVMKPLTDADALALQTALASDATEYILRLKYKSIQGNTAPISVIARKNIDESSSGLFFFLGWHIGVVGIADEEIYYITQLAHAF